MKKLIVLILMLCLFTPPSIAVPKKKRIADKKFWFSAAVMVAVSVLDIESTKHAMNRDPNARELNSWLYGKRPTRKKMYGILLPVTAAEIWAMWFVKKDADNKAWVVIPVVHTGAHGFAAGWNYAHSKPTCPANGAGCR